jgi:hypothetical protein
VSWDQRFDRPVVLPDGKTLRTLDDTRLHILSLPKSEHDTTAWQVVIEALLVAANVSESEIEKPVIRPFDPGSRSVSVPRQSVDECRAQTRRAGIEAEGPPPIEADKSKRLGAFSQMARLQHDREYFDAAYWRKRARGTMAKAATTHKQEVRERLLKVANEYEAIALRAERRADPPTK